MSFRHFVFACLVPVAVASSTAIVACEPPAIPSGPATSDLKARPPKKDAGAGTTTTNKPPTTPAGSTTPPPPPPPSADQPPTLTTISPSAISIGQATDVELTLTGTRFAAGAQIDIAGAKLPASFDSATQLKVRVPADKLKTAGTLRVAVEVKPGVQSNPLSFTVANPTNITITDLNPKSTVLGANNSVTLTVAGSGFTQTSVVKLNGAQLQTTFVSNSNLSAVIPATSIIDAGRVSVTVSTGTDVVSLPAAFEIQNPSPSTNSISPSSIAAGSSATAITISGSGFTRGSEVLSGATVLASTFLSATQIRATVPSTLITTQGASVKLVVQTGAPGGGTSIAQSLTVTAAASTGTTSGGTSGGTTSTGSPDCVYLCKDYGYVSGQCYADYLCLDSGQYAGCLASYPGCGGFDNTAAGGGGGGGNGGTSGGVTTTCSYDCKAYDYSIGECFDGWYCDFDGCLSEAFCN